MNEVTKGNETVLVKDGSRRHGATDARYRGRGSMTLRQLAYHMREGQ